MNSELREALAERKLLELKEKLAGIGVEFDAWSADAGSGRPLRKHKTQIERLTNQLRGMADDIGERIEQFSASDEEVLVRCRQLQSEMLEVHRLWDHYRSKLNLRYVPWFSKYLAAADEFAWACYAPMQDAFVDGAAPALRGGPLVHLSGDFSPFTDVRGNPFEVPDVPGTVTSAQFQAALAALPIPLVGVPWYQVAHLPDTVLIAHEVGHDVERDFDLTRSLNAAIELTVSQFGPEKQFAWRRWRPELWADLYGVLAAGPAFVSATRDLLVTNPAELVAEASAPDVFAPHPPAALRMRAMTRALTASGFASAATAQWEAWQDMFPTGSGETLAATDAVVDALQERTLAELGDKRLCDVVSFTVAQHTDAVNAANLALADAKPQIADIRCLVAAARLAFDKNPERYRLPRPSKVGSQQRLLDRAVEAIGDQVRSRAAEKHVSADDDRAAGRALFQRLIRTDDLDT